MSFDRVESGRMDIGGSFERAVERARFYCFDPVRPKRWLLVGLLAFMEMFVQGGGGGGGGGGNTGGGTGGGGNFDDFRRTVQEGVASAAEWINDNFLLFFTILILVTLVVGTILTVLYWLGCRGQVMLVRAVRRDEDRLGNLWRETRESGWSLFWFRVLVASITFPIYLIIFGVPFVVILFSIMANTVTVGSVIGTIVPFVLILLVVGVIHALILMFNRNFVVPIMDIEGVPSREAWSIFREMARGNGGALFLFVLVKIGFAMGMGIVRFLTCLACCIGLIPVIGQAVIAPVYVFERAYSLCVLDSLKRTAPVFEDVPPPVSPGLAPPPRL